MKAFSATAAATATATAASALALVAAVVLAGCSTGGGAPAASVPPAAAPASSAPSAPATPGKGTAPSAGATADPAVPVLDLKASARANLAYFNQVMHSQLDHNQNALGKDVIDHLVQAGFPKKAMEVTRDRTAIDLKADNIEFSVKLNGTCLIGQAGNTGFASFTALPTSTGRCLIGSTRAIDW